MNHLRPISFVFASLVATALPVCTPAGPPAFPDGTTAALAGPLCERQGGPCLCANSVAEVGQPPEGLRRFEVRLPATRGTASAVAIDGVGTLLRDEENPGGSCFYLDLRPGATYHVRYLARAHSQERGISVAFGMRELAPRGGWYEVIAQRCGSSDEPCGYRNVAEWTADFGGGGRFHDPCGSTLLEEVRVEGGVFDQRFEDAQFSFDLEVMAPAPERAPGSACQRRIDGTLIELDAGPDADGDETEAEADGGR